MDQLLSNVAGLYVSGECGVVAEVGEAVYPRGQLETHEADGERRSVAVAHLVVVVNRLLQKLIIILFVWVHHFSHLTVIIISHQLKNFFNAYVSPSIPFSIFTVPYSKRLVPVFSELQPQN